MRIFPLPLILLLCFSFCLSGCALHRGAVPPNATIPLKMGGLYKMAIKGRERTYYSGLVTINRGKDGLDLSVLDASGITVARARYSPRDGLLLTQVIGPVAKSRLLNLLKTDMGALLSLETLPAELNKGQERVRSKRTYRFLGLISMRSVELEAFCKEDECVIKKGKVSHFWNGVEFELTLLE